MESKGNWKYPTEKRKSRKYFFILPARNTIVKGKGTLKVPSLVSSSAHVMRHAILIYLTSVKIKIILLSL